MKDSVVIAPYDSGLYTMFCNLVTEAEAIQAVEFRALISKSSIKDDPCKYLVTSGLHPGFFPFDFKNATKNIPSINCSAWPKTYAIGISAYSLIFLTFFVAAY